MAKTNSKPDRKTHAASHAAYDEVPYDSLPFPQTNPLLLQGIARLFGLSVPSPARARILEIGCSSGTNILSIAARYPESACVGIDYSKKQIDIGRKEIEGLGITNIELKHMSVMDVTKSLGLFDYIICHGVLSWVPQDVQDKILEVCNTNLSPDGIAYISYNTLPGWNSVRSVRDMLLYHTARYSEPAEKASQARQLLKFMHDSTRQSKSTLAGAIDREIQLLSSQPDYYLLHDHLEENNHAFYFHEFMDRASRNGLQYVGDTTLENMYSGNFPAAVAEVLATSTDIVRTEQYIDFLNDRRFRCTLLCHKDRILNRNISGDVLKDGWLASRFSYPEGFAAHDITARKPLEFATVSSMKLTAEDPVVLGMLQVLMEHRKSPISMNDMLKALRDKLKKAKVEFKETPGNTLADAAGIYALRFLFIGGVHFYASESPFVTAIAKKPVLSPLARFQSQRQEWVTNQRQESVNLSTFDKILMRYVDGTRDTKALLEAMLPHFACNELVLNENNAVVSDPAIIREKITPVIPQALERFAELALLIA